ncbi:MAG: type IV pilus secretin PilQ [Candidatus Omnitrophota bacterium]
MILSGRLRIYAVTLLIIAGVFGLSPSRIVAEELRPPKSLPVEPLASSQEAQGIETPVVSAEDAGSQLITLNFRNADIAEVISVFAEKTGYNMVVGPDVKAEVNIELNNMPWEKALDVLLKNYNLTYKKEGNLIRIMSLEQLRQEEEKIPLVTKVVAFNFASAEDIKTAFTSMLSSRGKIEVNTRTNSLIITDLPENIAAIEAIASSLDNRTPQVMIEALMADVKVSDDEQLGIQWKIARNLDKTAPYGKSAKAVYDQTLGLTGSVAGAITFGQTIFKYTDLTYILQLWQEQKRVNILAHPIIMTLDNQLAHIELLEQIPYTQQSQSTDAATVVASTAFKEAGIKLDVTPHITTKDNFISLNLKVEQSFRTGFTPDNQPIIDSRKAETNLLVKDGETIVIGGLRKKEDTVTIDKVPFFSDIPFFGVLFRKRTKAVTDVDLLIFVTPKIVEQPKMTVREKERLELFNIPPVEGQAEPAPAAAVAPAGVPAAEKEEEFELRPPA